MSNLAVPNAQQVAFVKNYEELAQVTTWKAYAVKAGSVLLLLSLVNDIRKRNITQGIAHMWCLGVNWILHNAIYVKDLEDLVPVLGATAQRYSEEIVNLEASVADLRKATQEFQGMSEKDIAARQKKLEAETAEIDRLTLERAKLEGAIDIFQGHVRTMSGVLESPHLKAFAENPQQIAEMLKAAVAQKLPDNVEANQLAGRLIEVLA